MINYNNNPNGGKKHLEIIHIIIYQAICKIQPNQTLHHQVL